MASAPPPAEAPAAAAAPPAAGPFGMDEDAAALKAFAEIPIIGGVVVREAAGGNGVHLEVKVQQRNLAANSQRKYSLSVVLPDAPQPAAAPFVSPPMELGPSVVSSLSPSGRYTFKVKSGLGEGKPDGCSLEVWDAARLVVEVAVPPSVHGGVMADGWFSLGPAWSPEEGRVAYVAEAPSKDKTPAWGGEAVKEGAGPKTWKGQGEWQEDWGELYAGKRPPCLFVFDIKAASVKRVLPLDDDFSTTSFGQPAWTPDGSGLVAVAWPHLPVNFEGVAKRLGVVYCTNRPSHLLYLPLGDSEEAAPIPLAPGVQGTLSPTFSPDGQRLLFLSHAAAVASGVHNATAALMSLPWPQAAQDPSMAATALVPVVQLPDSSSSFPGLYATAIPKQAFLDADSLLMNTQWRSQTAVVKITLSTGQVTPVTPLGVEGGSWVFCGAAGGVLVATRAHPTQPPQVMVARPGTGSDPWQWHSLPLVADSSLHSHPSIAPTLSNIAVDVLTLQPCVGPPHPFEAITLFPRDAKGPVPTVVLPHGGPHAAFPVFFFMPYLLLLRAGYGLVAVNYRGSTGFGEESLQSLPGHIGTHDVADCIAALDAVVEAGLADPERVAVVGGSHGGFLTGHLLGQHPQRFKCGVMRNPVCNLAHMSTVTDIMDWTYIEAYGTREGRKQFTGRSPTPDQLRHFFSVSPAAHVDTVSAPVALMLGAKDLRVPFSDGKQYAAELRARGVATHVVVFPEDTHGLDRPQTEYEQWLTVLWWLRQHGL